MKRQEVYMLVDSLEYAGTNCYQHQLSYELEAATDCRYVPLAQLEKLRMVPSTAVVFCRLKLRHLLTNIDRIASAVGDRQVVVYDQDPWESFMIGGEYYDAYA